MTDRTDVSRRVFLKSAGFGTALSSAAALPAEKPSASSGKGGGKTEVKPSAYAEIKAELEEYGYVVLRDLIPRKDSARLERWVRELMSRDFPPGKRCHREAELSPL